MSMTEQDYMRRAIELARKGEGWCHPNPMVGAVIVKDGKIIGEGYHARCGELHAERNAIASLTESAEGATIYVTLEPCCHYGRTPPCTEAIMEHQIARVVIGSRDPNPKVSGGGARVLREAGIEVVEDFLREECDALNPVFFHYITTKTPYVIMKYAMTADGKIATKTGASKWITGTASRERVQELRHACMGIMVGIGTVRADDPMLNCRLDNGRDPVRIICDSGLSIDPDCAICRTAGEIPTVVACAVPGLPEGIICCEDLAASDALSEKSREKIEWLINQGVQVLNVSECTVGSGSVNRQDDSLTNASAENMIDSPMRTTGLPTDRACSQADCAAIESQRHGRVDLRRLMSDLGQMEIDSILLEGGGTLNESALRAGIVQEIQAFIAPKLFGGHAKSPVEGLGVEWPDEAVLLSLNAVEQIGDDLLLRYLLKK